MKKFPLLVLFILITSSILAADWKILSDYKSGASEMIYVVNAKTGYLYSFLFNESGIEELSLGTYKSDEWKDVIEHSAKGYLQKSLSGTFHTISESKLLSTEERLQIWNVIAEYQKKK